MEFLNEQQSKQTEDEKKKQEENVENSPISKVEIKENGEHQLNEEQKEDEQENGKETADSEEELSNEDKKTLERIQLLDNYCIKLNKKITELERTDVNLSEEMSTYAEENILKARFVKAYRILSKLIKKNRHLIDIGPDTKTVSVGRDPQFSKLITIKSKCVPNWTLLVSL